MLKKNWEGNVNFRSFEFTIINFNEENVLTTIMNM